MLDTAIIREAEGCRLHAYLDSANVPTIGYGSTYYLDGARVKIEDSLKDEAEARELFDALIERDFLPSIRRIPSYSRMNDNQRSAILSFAYNCGEYFYSSPGFGSITHLLKNPSLWRDRDKVESVFDLYIKSAGRVEDGLIKRRASEAKLFLTPMNTTKKNEQEFLPMTALEETWLKKDFTLQASQLDNTQKSFCGIGKSYRFIDITDEEPEAAGIRKSGHALVQLDWGCGQWFIFQDHWELPGDREIEFSIDRSPAGEAVLRQLERLQKYVPFEYSSLLDKVQNTTVKYYSQRDNYRDAHRTCNSSSNCAYTDWLLKVCDKRGIENDNEYLKEVFNRGDTIYHGIQTKVIEEVYGFKTKWIGDRDLTFVKELLLAGFPVVCNLLHRGSLAAPSGGHVICLTKYNREKKFFVSHDPYGTLESNYKDHNGQSSVISEREFVLRWQGGYRILSEN